MNLNQLWSGNDYAYYDMRGRGEVYRANARRVRVKRAYQKKQWGNERYSGFAEVAFLKDDGTPMLNHKDEPRVEEVRARDIAMLWEDYEDERAHRNAERERIQREREEAAAREQAANTTLLDCIVDRYKIPRELVTSIDNSSVRISRIGLEKELGLG